MSLPILVCTALEFISALYTGRTSYKDASRYNAADNAEVFIGAYFPDNYRKFPLIVWDGIRNGLVHTFSAKPLKHDGMQIQFSFFVHPDDAESHVIKDSETYSVTVNAFELCQVLEKAVDDYRQSLQTDEDLQNNFILAWSSIEGYERDIDSDPKKSREARLLFSEMSNVDYYPLVSE